MISGIMQSLHIAPRKKGKEFFSLQQLSIEAEIRLLGVRCPVYFMF